MELHWKMQTLETAARSMARLPSNYREAVQMRKDIMFPTMTKPAEATNLVSSFKLLSETKLSVQHQSKRSWQPVSCQVICPPPQDSDELRHSFNFGRQLIAMADASKLSVRKQAKKIAEISQKAQKNKLNWNPLQKLAAATLDMVESHLIPRIEGRLPLPSTSDPTIQLAGNFAPVPECPVQHDLEIAGELPANLEGVYVRNGANPRFNPEGGHHFFDGDGMLHAITFKQGRASYCCRYTRTYRLEEEEKLGRAMFPKAIGELHGHGGVARLALYGARGLFGLVDGSKGMGVANAGLIFFNKRLLAMSEDDLPYAVTVTSDGDLQTLGRYNFKGQLSSPMIAHPKKDPKTGELFTLSYDVVKKPYLKYFVFSPDGTKGPDVTISLAQPTMIHDFAITENYVVIPDQQVVFRLQELLKGGSPVIYDRKKKSRFGILPKYDKDESRVRWIEVPDCFCFHLWNSWEDKDEVVVIGSCMTPPDCIFNESDEAMKSILCEIRLDLRTGTSSRKILANLNLEAGQVNRKVLGRKSRYAYLAIADPWPKVSGIAKVDLQSDSNSEDQVIAKFLHGSACYGGEPFFVPRSPENTAAPEDDGYLLTFRHNEKTGQSELLVLNASSPSLNPVAIVKLPSRVPYGFHGTFIDSRELSQQNASL
ncbi:hypothetical protein O6H91_08G081700 [Diphasiastrum complanatum]|uniref:Uncharacterized protein n=2 Tax=Diphasiastrum complanatum TaxID=34168 RepID=A0ACC2CZ81_DIPCM|nr:hypothetical protein O6H91_08G080800 [Diphasiastrum complanatum]KAJ7547349.1 hypothetical protein O6H91_08G081700 [Diphasiastrum complanatum]